MYYGVTCGDMTPSPTSDSTNIVLIVAVVLVVTAVIIVVVSIVMWKCKVVPKTKTHDYYNHKYLATPTILTRFSSGNSPL